MKRSLLSILLLALCLVTKAQITSYTSLHNIPYYTESEIAADDYIKERCVLDIYHPADIKDFPTVVWFHGGGLTGGNKSIPKELMNQGMAVMAEKTRD